MSGPLVVASRNNVAGGSAGYSIANSLRFDGSNDYLSRTFGTPTNNTVWTFSCWVKRGKLSTNQTIMGGSTYAMFGFHVTDDYAMVWNNAGAASGTATGQWRDPTAWYHYCVVSNGTTITVYINNVAAYTWTTTITNFNSAGTHYIGRDSSGDYLDGYLSEIYFVDGQALTPSSFGELNADNVWVPKAYTGTYGNNGFHLDFSDGTSTTTLGYDAAGSNDWTLSGMTRAAGVNECWMVDTPTDNFATLNTINKGTSAVLSNGSLSYSNTATPSQCPATIAVSAGKWVWEVTAGSATYEHGLGWADANWINGSYAVYNFARISFINGNKRLDNGSLSAYGTGATAGDVYRFEADLDNGSLVVFRNNSSMGTLRSWTPSGVLLVPHADYSTTAGAADSYNFGQRDFAHTPSPGFKALSTANLPAVAIPDPSLHFDVVLDSGANIKTAMDALFSGNVFEWIKDRANSNNHQLADVNRGLTAILQSNTTAAETTYSAPSGSSVGCGWKAGGAGVTNTAGSITSTVSANTTAGFSIVTYTGTGANATVGHGLGVAPAMVIAKARTTITTARNWPVWHKSIGGTDFLDLNLTNGKTTLSTVFNGAPTSTVVNIGTDIDVNQTGPFVMYCFAEIPGYSKFGSYTGNGSADGPFVFCRFRPRYVLVKCSSTTGNWELIDTARDDYNVSDAELIANGSAVEATLTMLDITANGFKLRTTDADFNSAQTYIFAAFAEHPFGGSNISPSPAR